MPMNFQPLMLFIPMIGFFVAGAILLRVYSDTNNLPTLVASLVSYGLGSFLLTRLMQGGNFGVLISMSNTTQLAVIVLISMFVFNEPLTRVQWVGFGLAMIAVTLMAMPSRAS